MVERDMTTAKTLNTEMKAFISAVFGNDGWIKLVEARFLRRKQNLRAHEYDPDEQHAVKVYVMSNFQVPRAIQDELPTHGTD